MALRIAIYFCIWLFLLSQTLPASDIWRFERYSKIFPVDSPDLIEVGKSASKNIPIVEILCDDLCELVLEYLDFISGLNVRCSSKKLLEIYSRSIQRRVQIKFWNRFISDNFDLIRENRLGQLYIIKRMMPKFVDYLLPFARRRKDRLTAILENLPITFKAACILLSDWYEHRDRHEQARIVDRMLRCKFISIQEVNFESIESVFRTCFFYCLKDLALPLFLMIKERYELDEEEARSFLARLIIIFNRREHWEAVRLLYSLCEQFGYTLTPIETLETIVPCRFICRPTPVQIQIMRNMFLYEY